MNQKNDPLKELLISQYSRLSNTSLFKLTERLKDKSWWSKEEKSLKIQRMVSGIGSFLVFLGCCFVLVISSINGKHFFGNPTVPLTSFAGLIFSLILTLKIESKVKEKVRLFELLKISFDFNGDKNLNFEKA